MNVRTAFGASALACVLAACSHQQSAQNTSAATQTPAPAQAAVGRDDLVGDWTCHVTNGQIEVVTTSTVRADGTAVGRGTAYGHTTPPFQSSWAYTPTGPMTGRLRSDNMRFAAPHYTAIAAITWHTRDHYSAVTLSDSNPGGVGSKLDCVRR